MKVFVAVKPVADDSAKVRVKSDGSDIDIASDKMSMNPFDEIAQAARRRGFKMFTELGDEKQCLTCGEFWPADTEFFEAKLKTRDRLSSRCIACVRDKIWSSVLF